MRTLLVLLLLLPFQAFAIDFVKVGNPANKPASNGKGTVAYVYEISKYEITNAEYCDFLNSVAAQDDKYGLFSPLMEEHFFGGICKIRVGEHYLYKVKDGYGNFPVVGVTWMSAVRYCNWLHYNALNSGGGVKNSQRETRSTARTILAQSLQDATRGRGIGFPMRTSGLKLLTLTEANGTRVSSRREAIAIQKTVGPFLFPISKRLGLM